MAKNMDRDKGKLRGKGKNMEDKDLEDKGKDKGKDRDRDRDKETDRGLDRGLDREKDTGRNIRQDYKGCTYNKGIFPPGCIVDRAHTGTGI